MRMGVQTSTNGNDEPEARACTVALGSCNFPSTNTAHLGTCATRCYETPRWKNLAANYASSCGQVRALSPLVSIRPSPSPPAAASKQTTDKRDDDGDEGRGRRAGNANCVYVRCKPARCFVRACDSCAGPVVAVQR